MTKTQLFYNLADVGKAAVHFADDNQLVNVRLELTELGFSVFEINANTIRSNETMYEAFAKALKAPPQYYGPHDYAPNADAFLERLEDLGEWLPAAGYVTIVQSAEHFWKTAPRVAGMLVQLWQYAAATWSSRGKPFHLVFVW